MMRSTAIAALLLACSAAAWAQGNPNLKEVTVTGQGGDKDLALLDAKRKAVEQAAGTVIYSHSQAKDFALVKDTILTRSAGFLQSFKVLSTREADDGAVEVKISAVVSIQGVEDMWGVVTNILKDVGHPKIMVFVNEKIRNLDNHRDEQVDDSTVQTRIEAMLLESGFLLVDKKQLKEIDRKDLEAAVAEDNVAKAQAVAKRFGAQIFITGSSNATGGPKTINGMSVFAYEGEANIKVYRSDTAQMMSAVPGVPTRGVQQVWRSAAKQALDAQAQQVAVKVRFDILRFWQDALAGRGEVQLHVEGITFGQNTKLKKALAAVKEVKEVNGEFHNGVAELRLQSDLGAEKLAEKLSEVITNLDVSDVSANVIKAKLKSE